MGSVHAKFQPLIHYNEAGNKFTNSWFYVQNSAKLGWLVPWKTTSLTWVIGRGCGGICRGLDWRHVRLGISQKGGVTNPEWACKNLCFVKTFLSCQGLFEG